MRKSDSKRCSVCDNEYAWLCSSRSLSPFSPEVGSIISTRLMLHFTKKIYGKDAPCEIDAEGEVIREAKDEKDFEYIYIFLDFLYESGYFDDTNAVMLDRKFDVSIIWGGKYKIIFGDVTDLETKISVLEEIMKHDSLEYAEKAVIDVSSPSEAYARPDPSLDFSEYVKKEEK